VYADDTNADGILWERQEVELNGETAIGKKDARVDLELV
jgi:hypothetical protein